MFCIPSIKFTEATNILCLIHCELSDVVELKEILNHNQLQVSELFSLYSNNCRDEFWFSDTTNMQRQNITLSIIKPIQFNLLN